MMTWVFFMRSSAGDVARLRTTAPQARDQNGPGGETGMGDLNAGLHD